MNVAGERDRPYELLRRRARRRGSNPLPFSIRIQSNANQVRQAPLACCFHTFHHLSTINMSETIQSAQHLQKSDTNRIIDSIVACVERAKLEREPFEHFHMQDIFPPDVYSVMVSSFPARDAYHNLRHKDANLPDGTSTRKMFEFYDERIAKLPSGQAATWSVIRDALCDVQVRNAIFSKLRKPIEARIGHESEEVRLNGDNVENVEAYPRPALYRDESGYRITPHPDSPLKIVTVQFYLPADQSQRQLGTSLYRRKTWAQRLFSPLGSPFERVRKFDFLPNSGYGFAVTNNSFHGREQISAADGLRHSILLFYLREAVRLTY